MYYLVADKLMTLLRSKQLINKKYEKIIGIVLEYVAALGINMFLAAGIGHTFQIEKQLIVFSIFYTVMRVSNGGNYLKVDIKNSVTRWGCAVLFIRVAENVVPDLQTKGIVLSILLLCFIIMLTLAPCVINNINVSDEIKQYLRKSSILFISAIITLLLVACLLCDNSFIISATMGVFLQSLTLLYASAIKKQSVEYYPAI